MNRNKQVAQMIINHSIKAQPHEFIRIIAYEFETKPLVKELVKAIYQAKANPIVEFIDAEVMRLQMEANNEQRIALLAKWELEKTKDCDAVIVINTFNNQFELNGIDKDILKANQLANKEASRIRINERKWVLLSYPTYAQAANAKMSMEAYEDYYYQTMLVDYKQMALDAQNLKDLMLQTDQVKIVGPNTNISFSIKDMPVIICAGENNLPDGEVFSAPLKNSVNGTIQYNTTSFYNGIEFNNVYLEVKEGKIINATSTTNNDKIMNIFASDEGASYFGEFALGINKSIVNATGDILADEKIYGSFHLTPGQAYEDCNNGNNSIIHWDLVCIQQEALGGGQIYFDDVLIRDNGIFIPENLKGLNVL
ncbi:MAG: aminopeptidase [Bacilli bacterium]